MTPLELLTSLKNYCEKKTGGMMLIARVQKNDTEAGERPPKVFIGNLPDKEDERKAAPYILLKLLTSRYDDSESICRVRIICVTFAEDKQENYIQCLNLITRLTEALLEDVVIDKRYSCQKPIETVIYDDDLEVYQIGEIMTVWEMPETERKVREYLI